MNMYKNKSYNTYHVKNYSFQEILNNKIPKVVEQANEILCLPNTDMVIQILRHFKWNQTKVEEQWFANQEKLVKEIGLEFDKSLLQKYPDINASTAA